MLDTNRQVASAIPTNFTAARWQPGEQDDVRLRFAPHHTTTAEAQATMLNEVGHVISATKDRLGEIQNKALMKLRGLLAEPA